VSETTHRSLRLALASLLLAAVVSRLFIVMSRGEMASVELLGSFTVLSNILAAMMLLALAMRPAFDDSTGFASFRGAVTVYMAVTALLSVAHLLFPGIIPDATEPWVDWTLRLVGPLAVVADWVIHPPTPPIAATATLIWTLPPVLYLGFALVRGAIVDDYPYSFLDPGETGGQVSVAIWSGAAIIVTLGVSLAIRWWSARQNQKTA
jgi:hypothetical protein